MSTSLNETAKEAAFQEAASFPVRERELRLAQSRQQRGVAVEEVPDVVAGAIFPVGRCSKTTERLTFCRE